MTRFGCHLFRLSSVSIIHFQQGESYARPTVIGSYDAPSSRRSHQVQQPSPFSTVAMDELCALERAEALRRAEYEARHAEALRRAELVSRHAQNVLERQPLSQRLSKSATTSPVLRDRLPLATLSDERIPVPVLGGNDWHSPPLSPDEKSSRVKSNRRLSGPAWMLALDEQPRQRPSISQSRSSGYLVETLRHSPHHNISSRHPYHQYHYRPPGEGVDHRGKHAYDELPSPISSDGEHPDRIDATKRIFHLQPSAYGQTIEHSPPHYSSSVRTTNLTEVACTPSTSPFLGPLRTLNIHSANPSRVPSPISLPPPATARPYDFRDGIYSDESMTPSRAGSVYGSPPSAGLNIRSQIQPAARKGDGHFTFQSTYGPSTTSSQMHTPLLTSGTSSIVSSPGSIPHLPSPAPMGLHRDTNGTAIASGSRPSSPLHSRGSPPSTHATNRHHHPIGNQSTHLAHSVSVAFGSTPIHSHPPSRRPSPPPHPSIPRNTSWSAPSDSPHQFSHQPSSFGHVPFTFGLPPGAIATGSIPGSRAPSPPIRLPALKTLPGENNKYSEGDAAMDSESTRRATEKIKLPHFREFEASTRIPLSVEPVRSSSELKMSIDFVNS